MAGVLLYGGSFNPIHHGHLIVCRAVAEQLNVDRVILVPSASPPHKSPRDLAPAADRLAMCRLAVRENPQFEVSDWETLQGGPNYTLLTVRQFRSEFGAGTALYWLIGMDTLRELTTWYHIDELCAECTLVTAGRPGADPPDLSSLQELIGEECVRRLRAHILATPLIEISASNIRARLRKGLSVRYLTPEAVVEYVHSARLYCGT